MADIAAHQQTTTHNYIVNYPSHEPRPGDPHYVDFNHYRETHIATAKCQFSDSADVDQCTTQLELHHAFVEFSLQNGVDLQVLERDYPGISNPGQVGAWVESDKNFEWLCSYHHRGHGGAHVSAHSDYVAERYVKDLIS